MANTNPANESAATKSRKITAESLLNQQSGLPLLKEMLSRHHSSNMAHKDGRSEQPSAFKSMEDLARVYEAWAMQFRADLNPIDTFEILGNMKKAPGKSVAEFEAIFGTPPPPPAVDQ
ncbi:MAG: hypothetical protein MHMPM18_003819 [Marteilia pararefringens]